MDGDGYESRARSGQSSELVRCREGMYTSPSSLRILKERPFRVRLGSLGKHAKQLLME